MIIRSSEICIDGVADIIRNKKNPFSLIGLGAFYRGPASAFQHKLVFVGEGKTPAERKQSCIQLRDFLKKEAPEVRVWHELLDEHGALIIDHLSVSHLASLQNHSPLAGE